MGQVSHYTKFPAEQQVEAEIQLLLQWPGPGVGLHRARGRGTFFLISKKSDLWASHLAS